MMDNKTPQMPPFPTSGPSWGWLASVTVLVAEWYKWPDRGAALAAQLRAIKADEKDPKAWIAVATELEVALVADPAVRAEHPGVAGLVEVVKATADSVATRAATKPKSSGMLKVAGLVGAALGLGFVASRRSR